MRPVRTLAAYIDRRPVLGRALTSAWAKARMLTALPGFLSDWRRYQQLPGSEPLRLADADPRISDRVTSTPYDPHYLYQGAWAAGRIFALDPREHVDVGSQLTFVSVLAARLPVRFVDIRPPAGRIPGIEPVAGDLLAMPFPSGTVMSLSCLHVVEHVGLGRYGDDLNPAGSRQALAELERVLAPRGNLFLSLPIGRPRVCFNAHRVHDPREIALLMGRLDLAEFSAVDDDGCLHIHASIDEMAELRYGCGLFWFRGRDTN